MELAPGLYSVKETRGIFVHAFLVDSEDGLTLVDTLQSRNAQRIISAIENLGKTVKDLKHIVLSHAHNAHLGGLARLKELSGAKVYCHKWEADIVSGDRRIQNTTLRPLRPYRIWPFQVASRFARHIPCQIDHTIDEGDQVGPLQVLHTPGHTPGHLAFYWPERRALFAGDMIVTWPQLAPGWPGFMLNARQNIASLRRIAELDSAILAVGHGDPLFPDGGAQLRKLMERTIT